MADVENQAIADRLRELADLLAAQEANPYRVRAYRRAADWIEAHDAPIARIAEQAGREGLIALPTIGAGIADGILQLLETDRLGQLERMRGQTDPEDVFATLPGIGEKLARRIHDTLHVDSLAELEVAAHDGRLAEVPGVGPRRAEMIRATLAERLGRTRRRASPDAPAPEVATLLDVDAEYRRKAQAEALPRIAPRRFNPRNEAWLPILHTEREPWQFTALFSNTARAHELDRTRDWVVLYYQTDHEPEGQCTVVTETRGPLEGMRVVRGREAECRRHHLGGSNTPRDGSRAR